MSTLIQHQKLTKHCPCPSCDLLDNQDALVEARLPQVAKYSCTVCRLRFAKKHSLETHQRDRLHAYCNICCVYSPTVRLHALHIESHVLPSSKALQGQTQLRCCDCEQEFNTESDLANHSCSRKASRKRIKSTIRCKECKRNFKTNGALDQHMLSVVHKPLSNIKCVADKRCGKKFNCPSAQLHHLEAGACVSGMTKAKLNVAIAANDPSHIITSRRIKEQSSLGTDSSAASTSLTRSPILTPTSTEFVGSYPSSGFITPASSPMNIEDFHSALNIRLSAPGTYQRCPLCPPSRTRLFKRAALQAHMSSQVHAKTPVSLSLADEMSFHCPRSLTGVGSKKNHIKQFSSVSGLAQHLESGACYGGKAAFKQVVEYVQGQMEAMGFGGLKLLS